MPGAARRLMDAFVSAVSDSSKLSSGDRERVIVEFKKAKEEEPPPTLVIIGEAGVGKTMTINSLFNAGQPVSAQRATTLGAVSMRVGPPAEELILNAERGLLRVFDMPGLGDRMSTYYSYKKIYLEVLPLADVILWVHPAEDRMLQFLQTAVRDIFVREMPHLIPRLIFGLNKADRIAPDNWNKVANIPSRAQLDNLSAREKDFQGIVREAVPKWQGSAVVYSAWTRYQLTRLFKSMIYAVPEERRWVLEDRMSLADFFELVDRGILRAAMDRAQIPAPVKPAREADILPDRSSASDWDKQTVEAEEIRQLKSLSPSEYAKLVSNPEDLVRFLRERSGRGGA
jgi:predicted GTPase